MNPLFFFVMVWLAVLCTFAEGEEASSWFLSCGIVWTGSWSELVEVGCQKHLVIAVMCGAVVLGPVRIQRQRETIEDVDAEEKKEEEQVESLEAEVSVQGAQENAVTESSEQALAGPGLRVLSGLRRTQLGKSALRRLRRRQGLPGNILLKNTSIPIELSPKWIAQIWQEGGEFILDFEGEKKRVRISEVQVHPVKREPQHVDLVEV